MDLNPRSLASIVLTPLLALAGLTVLSIPAHAVPDDGNCDLAGSGSTADPFLIGDAVELMEIDDCEISTGATYRFTDDIYLSGSELIEGPDSFVNFDADSSADFVIEGNGKQIHNLTIRNGTSNTGIFGFVDDNLIVRDLTVFADSVVGDEEAGILAGDVDGDFTAENVNIFVDYLYCHERCGVLVGNVGGDASVVDSTITVNQFVTNADIGSGLLFGEVEGSLTVKKSSISGEYRLATDNSDDRREIGGLVGTQEGGGPNNILIEDTYIDIDLLRAPLVDDDIYIVVGGAVGEYYPGSASTVSVKRSYVRSEFRQVRNFGGIFGRISTTSEVDLVVTDSRLDSDVRGDENGYADLGGLIGSLEVGGGSAQIIRTIIEPNLNAEDHGETDLFPLFEIAGGDPFDSVTVTHSVFDTDEWSDTPAGKKSKTSPSITGLTNRTSAQIKNDEGLPFTVGTKEQGVLGTDSWEFKSGSGPYPTITPNNFDKGSFTLPNSSISLTVNTAMSDFVINDSFSSRADFIRYHIAPELPRGLRMDPITGTISGTPREVLPSRSYELRVRTAKGFSDVLARLSISVGMPPTPAPEVIRDTVVIEREVPALYTGPLLTNVSKQVLSRCRNTSITLTGQDLDKLEKLHLGETEIEFEVQENQLVFTPSCVDAGEYSLKLESSGGTLDYKNMIQLVDVPTVENSFVGGLTQEKLVNAGSFKGYVAVYAKGYQGKRLSAKIGNDWVVVPSLSSNFERVTDFTGAGYDINVRIFIDGVLTREVPITTK